MNLYDIPIHSDSPSIVNAVIEIPKDTNVKYEYDSKLGAFKYDRSLLSAMVYPASYGFIPNTVADDGDALDVLIYNAMPIDKGIVVESRVIAVLDMEDGGKDDFKILATPTSHIRDYSSLDCVDPQFLKISQNFFAHYKDLNNTKVRVGDWYEKEKAYEIINESIKR